MLIVTYYCNNKALQSISLCITVIYAMVTNIDMLRLGIELVKKRLYNKNDRGINGRKRNNSIDNLKAICTFLIVCIHVPFPG